MIGEKLREFEIQSELGAGGYGAVYRAHDTSVDRDVAIKVILPQYADDPDFKQRFESEARLVAKLESRQIVPLHQFWQDEQGAFLVMRLIRGGSLRRIMAKQGAMSLSQVLRILSDIAEALSVAHENDVVHRDLKPENILIDERGNAYLTDFGIAKRTTEAENITEADAIVGTWAYLSPEQVQNIDVTSQTDIYAFGILLYEMLAGKHPFQGVPVPMMVMKHLQEALPDIADERPDLPPELDGIIQKATAKDPDERYASPLEMIADLKAAAKESSQNLVPIKTVERKKTTSPEERNRQAMLQNVRKFWIEGVLENSVHEAAMIDLGMTSKSNAVDNPWDTVIRTATGEEILSDEGILNIFEQLNGKLLILGDPGSGKTTTLLNLALELLERANADDQHPIPVVFNLSSWSEKQQPITIWLVDELNNKYQVPRKVGQKWVDDEELLLLLDGLDEVAEDVRDDCVKAINTYRTEHGFVDVVVCSRITDYDALSQQMRLNGAIVIQPLDDVQIVEYLDKLGQDVAILRDLIGRDAQLHQLAQSPLMLSIMVLAYRGKTADDVPDFDNIDAQRQHLFELYVQRMFERRAVEKPYPDTETRHYLIRLATQLQQHANSIFYLENLQPDWLNEEDSKWRYAALLGGIHFLFSFVGMVLAFIFLISVLANNLSRFGVEIRIASQTILLWCVILSFIGSIPTTIINYRKTRQSPIQPVERSNWSIKAVRQRITEELRIAIILGMVFSTFIAVIFGFLFGLQTGLVAGMGILIGHFLQFFHSRGYTTSTVQTTVRPNQSIWQSLQEGLQSSLYSPLFFCLGLGLMFSIAYDLRTGLALAAALALPSYLIGFAPDEATNPGSFASCQHFILRNMLERQQQIPRNLTHFLDYASSLILMRKVGGGYIFIHRYLLEYFADMETPESDQG